MRLYFLLSVLLFFSYSWIPVWGQGKELNVLSVATEEGVDSFSLKVMLSLKGNVSYSDEDGYSHRTNKDLEIDPIQAYDYVRVTPSIPFTILPTGNGLVLSGAFKPEKKYQVTVLKGFRTKTGVVLAADEKKDVTVGSFSPKIRFKSKSRYLPNAFAGQLSFESINVDKIQISVRQVYPHNIHQWLTSGDWASGNFSDVVKSKIINVKNKKNEKYDGVISLEDIAPTGKGVFLIKASSFRKDEPVDDEAHFTSYNRTSDTLSVVVTNISAVAKSVGKDEIQVWAFSTRDLTPLPNVTVEVYSESNKKLGSCQTSAGPGDCAVKWKDYKKGPYAIVLKSQNDMSFLRLADGALKNDRFHGGNRDYTAENNDFEGFVYSERDLFRPGEKVTLVTQLRNQKFDSAGKMPVKWILTGPKGTAVKESMTETNEQGLATFVFDTTTTTETGKYQAELFVGKKSTGKMSFLVEEFVPERIGLQVKSKQEVGTTKTPAVFDLQANYLFGPPVAETSFSTQCILRSAFAKIPKSTDFFTGPYSREEGKSITIDGLNGSTDKKGAATVQCDLSEVEALNSAYELRAMVKIEEAGSGRATTKHGSMIVSPADHLIGLKTRSKAEKLIVVDGGLFDFKGEAVSKKLELKARLYRLETQWHYSYDGYGSNWKVDEIIVPTGVEKNVSVNGSKFEIQMNPPPGWGQWLVRVFDPKSGNTSDLNVGYLGYYYGESDGPANKEPEDLKIQSAKSDVSPGERIKVMISAPFAGRLLLTTESSRIHESRWIQVSKPGPIDLEIKAPAVLPNFYLNALLFKNPQDGKKFIPARAYGAKSFRVIPEEHKLLTKIEMPEMTESRKELSIKISNASKLPATYSLAVVDEGILQMTAYKSPDPLKFFFEPRRMMVESFETMGNTMSFTSSKGSPGGDMAGGGGQKTMPVRLVSFFFPDLKSDDKGVAEIKIRIPEFQGKLRAMVVAHHKTKMGSADIFMTVKDPLVLQPTLPRFLTQQDAFSFPVAVTNTTKSSQNVSVKISTSDQVRLDSKEKNLVLEPNQMKIVSFNTQVLKPGTAEFSIEAVSQDGKLRSTDSYNLNVRPLGVLELQRLSFNSVDGIDLKKVVPAHWNTDEIQAQVMVANMPYMAQLSEMDELIHYPYGCIEQTTSSTLPLLGMEDLLKFIDRRGKNAPPVKEMARAGIERVLSMQTSDGGFAYWPGGNTSDPWGTAYATHMLMEAKKLGYEVPQSSINASLDYLQGYLRRPSGTKEVRYLNYDRSPYILFVAAKGGRAVTPELRARLKEYLPIDWSGLRGENNFLLAATAKLLGDKDTLDVLAKNDEIFTIKLVGQREDDNSYWSPIRSDGLRLAVMEDLWLNHPSSESLAQRVALNIADQKFYYSTQDLAWSILGLAKKARGVTKIDKALLQKVGLTLNGKTINTSFKTQDFPVWQLTGGKEMAQGQIKFSNLPTSSNGVWSYVNLSGYTKTPPVGNGLITVQRYFYNMKGQPIDTNNIKVGDSLVVRLEIAAKGSMQIKNIALVDRLPAGFEIENPRLEQSNETSWIDNSKAFKPNYVDIRDDRIQIFGDVSRTSNFYYTLRAVTPGTFVAPPSFVERMYDPSIFHYGQPATIKIVSAK